MTPPAPPPLTALSVDGNLLARLRHGRLTGHVESAFTHVINLLSCDDELVSLCARTLDDAPWSMRVDVDDWQARGIRAGTPVTLATDAITLGAPTRHVVVLTPGPREWHSKPVPLRLTGHQLAVRAGVLAELLDAHGARGGMRTPPDSANTFEAAMGAELRRGQDALHRSVLAGDGPGTSAAITQLLGLGPGLTPSGDDFLTGLALLAAQPGSRIPGYVTAAHEVLDRLPDRTTRLSRTTLREALRGRARQSLLDLLHLLLTPDELVAPGMSPAPAELSRRLRPPVDRVLAIGHTSGADLLSGLLTGLRLEAELKGSM
ncbi:DUF2877 domain-containing protein [Streptomyces endophyticus]|uniref:DUF2877 domain-containing protein n=1 Tax=Streptomyces endophyticus TaxID=714166 RepID=A0ABU6FF59_9ACTN|nr:DUF2877 domain-containing protein [Streptomyces endophyticus]MEB8341925.1 DUF2877 domain-containing protein [Streptomyces endophyticus]